MKAKALQLGKAMSAALFVLLLSVAWMTNAKAQTPYRQYSDNGILLNFHEIDNVDFRVFLLYNLSQEDQFILIPNEESGQFSIIANDEMDATDFYDAFETFYQNTYTDFSFLSKADIEDRMPLWKSVIPPIFFVSMMMDISLRNSRNDNNLCVNSLLFSPEEVVQFEAASTPQTADYLEGAVFDDGCLGSSYNPSWFHMRINTPGQFVIHMEGHDPNNPNTHRDIDFCMWGPFTDPTSPCVSQLTSSKIIDCGYSANYTEDAYLGYPANEHAHNTGHGMVNFHVPQTGEYYILMITNFSRQPCNIAFSARENFSMSFADANVKALCVANWDTDGDGELSFAEAAAVTSVGTVFRNNTSITNFNELRYFTGITSISSNAFDGCNHLTSIVLPNSVTSIGSNAFNNCTSLTSITIPNSVTSIGGQAFAYCSNLTSITIPNSVTSLGNYVFDFCTELSQIVVGTDNTVYDSRENCNAIIRTATNTLIAGCKNTVIPNSVTTIGNSAFYGYSSLTSIIIPGSIASIESWAFYGCSGLTLITSLAETPPNVGSNAFANVDKSIPVYVPNGTVSAYQAASGWNEFTNIQELGPSPITFADANVKALCVANWDTNGDGELSYDEAAAVTSVGTVFRNKNNITSFNELQYFTGLTSIGTNAFSYCSGLTSIVIPNSVTSIGSLAFWHCTSLTLIKIPSSVISMTSSSFYQCSGLAQIIVDSRNMVYDSRNNCNAIIDTRTNTLIMGCKNTVIPNTVLSIEGSAFSGCSGLVSIVIPNSVTSIGDQAFYGCSNLVRIVIPSSVISIPEGGNNAFEYCNRLEQIIVDSENIVYDSRENCNAIINTSTNVLIAGCKNTVIPNSVTTIGSSAFSGCSSLNSIVIPNSVISIEPNAFSYCRGLSTIEIPNSVISIGGSVFNQCDAMTSVTIGNSVTTIGANAFINCTGLTLIISLAETPPLLGNNAFSGVDKSIPVYVPIGTVSDYQTASGWNEFTNIRELVVGNDGPYCVGETIHLTAIGVSGASYSWTGPNNFRSRFQNPTRENCTMAMAGTYTCTITRNGQSASAETEVTIYPKPTASFTASSTTACVGASIDFTSTSITNPTGYTIPTCNWDFGDGQTASGATQSHTFNQTGTFIVTLSVASEGGYCTDEVTQTITVSEGEEIFYDPVNECHPYTWTEGNGQTYSEPGTYNVDYTDTSSDCPIIKHISITIADVVTEEVTKTECDSYTWTEGSGETYQSSGDYIWSTTTDEGCPKTVTLHLTINYSEDEDYIVTECDSYTWPYWLYGNEQTYTASGDYVCNTTTAQGCPKTVTLHLTINQSEEIYLDPVTECDSYPWEGQTITQSGLYNHETTTPEGCSRIEHLYVTINQSDEVYLDPVTECDMYVWHGQTYTQSGTYVHNTTTPEGCYRTEYLTVTINHSEVEEFTVTESNSYIWHGQTYTQSGTYTYETTTAQGCSRTEILHLTIESNHWIPVAEGTYPFSMTLYGVIQINGAEQYSDQLELGVFCGNECRGSAIASEFYLTHRYLTEVNVNGDSGQQLTFKLYDHATNQELGLTPPVAITFTIDGYGNPVNPYVLNFTSSVSITASTDPEGAGTVTGTGEYGVGSSCTLTASANTGFQFQNWTLNGTVVSTNPSYTFTVTEEANYVAHFQYLHTRPLVVGWNWWSTYIEQDGINGLEMLENSLGTSGIRIQGKNNSVDYFEYQGTGYWYGSLNTIANEQMYMIRTSATCDAVIVGNAALPANHPITINNGWNWIGYPNSQSVAVNAAMEGFAPEINDVIKGRNSASMYISYNGYQGWYGQLNTLEPGQGYMYKSNSDTQKTLTFQSGRTGDEAIVANITYEDNIFVPNTANYADNMIVTAVIDIDGEELRSEDYELAAFVGNECRGSVKLLYVEPYDRYVAMLMAFGDGEEELHFVLTDGNGTSWSNDKMTYVANSTVGTMTEPAVLHFEPLSIEDNIQKPVSVYPNPSNGIFNIEGEGIRKIEVIDAYGQVILSKEIKNTHIQVDLSGRAAGTYLLRVVTDGGVTMHKLVKNN